MRSLLLLSALLIPSLVFAQDKPEDWPEGSAMNTGLTANVRFEKADTDLNIAYQRILKNLPTRQDDDYTRKTLITAQREWIKYRDASCDLVGEISGGIRMWKSAYNSICRADMTEERTKELVKLFENSDN